MNLLATFPTNVEVTDQTIDITGFSKQWRENVAALVHQITAAYERSGKERYLVAIGGASGSSKSTTTKVIEYLTARSGVPAVSVSQDGYHFPQEYLLRTLDADGQPLAKHKGRYDSFDVSAMKKDLERFLKGETVSFPSYSRKIHNPVPNAVRVEEARLLLFEGLWLLYDQKPWNELLPLYNLKIFFHADSDMRKKNTITRHVRGNEHPPREAEQFYEDSDAKNAELILGSIAKHDLDFHTV